MHRGGGFTDYPLRALACTKNKELVDMYNIVFYVYLFHCMRFYIFGVEVGNISVVVK